MITNHSSGIFELHRHVIRLFAKAFEDGFPARTTINFRDDDGNTVYIYKDKSHNLWYSCKPMNGPCARKVRLHTYSEDGNIDVYIE